MSQTNRRRFVKSVAAACVAAPGAATSAAAPMPRLKNFTPEAVALLENLTEDERVLIVDLMHRWSVRGKTPLPMYLEEDREIVTRYRALCL